MGEAMLLKVEKTVTDKQKKLWALASGTEHSTANVKSWFSVNKVIYRKTGW